MTAPVVVVGASVSALAFVERLRELDGDAEVVVVDADPDAPYDRPPLSKHYLTSGQADDIRVDWTDLDVTFHRARATNVDAGARVVGLRFADDHHEAISYSSLVIATGAVPARLPIEPPGTLTLRTAADARALRERAAGGGAVVIIGAGAIGVELASRLAATGAHVTLLDRAAGPLVRLLGGHLSEEIAQWLREAGIDCRFECDIRSITRDDAGWLIRLGDEEGLRADLVVSAVGARPAVGWLSESGLLSNGDLLVDDEGRVLVDDVPLPDVFAIGDAVSRRGPDGGVVRTESWSAAREHGARIAEHLLGAEHEPTPLPYFWTEAAGRNVQVVGVLHPAGDLVLETENPERRSALYRVDHEGASAWIGVNSQPRIARLRAGR